MRVEAAQATSTLAREATTATGKKEYQAVLARGKMGDTIAYTVEVMATIATTVDVVIEATASVLRLPKKFAKAGRDYYKKATEVW